MNSKKETDMLVLALTLCCLIALVVLSIPVFLNSITWPMGLMTVPGIVIATFMLRWSWMELQSKEIPHG